MTIFAGMGRVARGFGRASAVVLVVASAALAQERAPQAPVEVNPPPPVQSVPERQPGLLESFGRWVDETNANMRKGFDSTIGSMGNMSSSAESMAKGSADAAATVARGAADATKGTVDVLGRIGTTRVVTGRERCAIAPNGAPDCKLAAETMCKAKGFTTGNSVDYQTAENCPAQAFMNGRKPLPSECTLEHVVTKAMCQ